MGWTGIYNVPANKREYLTKELNSDRLQIVDSAQVGNTFYFACRGATSPVDYYVPDADGSVVFGLVVATQTLRKPRQFMYKLIDESSGPYQVDCPKRILDKLSPFKEDPATGGVFAREWREKCRLAKSKDRKVPVLAYIEFDKPLTFGKHGQAQLFQFRELSYRGKVKKVFYNPNIGYCRIPNVQKRSDWHFVKMDQLA